eukprot:scaffold76622_cov40-Attheya_sp.AAC.1
MECRQAVAGTVWGTLVIFISVNDIYIEVGTRHSGRRSECKRTSAEGSEMLRCGNYLGFLFQVDMSWHVNSVQGLSRHTTVTRPTQESENTEGTVPVHLIALEDIVQRSCVLLGDNGVDTNAGKRIR